MQKPEISSQSQSARQARVLRQLKSTLNAAEGEEKREAFLRTAGAYPVLAKEAPHPHLQDPKDSFLDDT